METGGEKKEIGHTKEKKKKMSHTDMSNLHNNGRCGLHQTLDQARGAYAQLIVKEEKATITAHVRSVLAAMNITCPACAATRVTSTRCHVCQYYPIAMPTREDVLEFEHCNPSIVRPISAAFSSTGAFGFRPHGSSLYRPGGGGGNLIRPTVELSKSPEPLRADPDVIPSLVKRPFSALDAAIRNQSHPSTLPNYVTNTSRAVEVDEKIQQQQQQQLLLDDSDLAKVDHRINQLERELSEERGMQNKILTKVMELQGTLLHNNNSRSLTTAPTRKVRSVLQQQPKMGNHKSKCRALPLPPLSPSQWGVPPPPPERGARRDTFGGPHFSTSTRSRRLKSPLVDRIQ